jgi:branched-chain amino acid transport system permease protein
VNNLISRGNRDSYRGCLPILTVFTIFLIMFPRFVSSYGLVLLTEVFIYAIFAMSLNLLLGYAGLPSLGHSAFFGVGGYTIAILVTKGGIGNFGLCLAVALLAAMILSLVFGFLAIRTSGIFFLMLTFALAQFVWAVIWSWRSLTSGDDGLPGIVRPNIGLHISMQSDINFYYFIVFFFALSMFLLYRICHSPFGYVLQGIRESETRMRVLGYDTWKYKYVGFILAGVFGGLAGVLKAYQDGFVGPLYASVFTSGMALLMCLTGGTRIFIGPAIGAAVIWMIRGIVSSYTENWSLVLGIIFIIVVMFARQGIAGYLLQLRKVISRVCTKD